MYKKTLTSVSISQTRLGSNFHFKDRIPNDLTSGFVYKLQCGICNASYYGECIRHWNVRIGKDIGISPLMKNQVNLRTASYTITCYFATIQHPITILAFRLVRIKFFLLELKDGLLILRDKLSLNRNITLELLYIFNRA